jgi:hypothetical protein
VADRLVPGLVGLALVAATACSSHPSATDLKQENRVSQPTQPSAPAQPAPPAPAPDCSASLRVESQSPAGVRLVATLRNGGSAPVHLLRSSRMPYVVVEEPDRIVVAWSIQPIPEDLDLGGIEPLDTAELAAGDEVRREATLQLPLQVSTHLRGPHRHEGTLPRTLEVVAEFGLVPDALDPKARHRQNYPALVASQRTCRSPALSVDLGAP